MNLKHYCMYHNEMYIYQNHNMRLFYSSHEDAINENKS